jgi:hypothetical protein
VASGLPLVSWKFKQDRNLGEVTRPSSATTPADARRRMARNLASIAAHPIAIRSGV